MTYQGPPWEPYRVAGRQLDISREAAGRAFRHFEAMQYALDKGDDAAAQLAFEAAENTIDFANGTTDGWPLAPVCCEWAANDFISLGLGEKILAKGRLHNVEASKDVINCIGLAQIAANEWKYSKWDTLWAEMDQAVSDLSREDMKALTLGILEALAYYTTRTENATS